MNSTLSIFTLIIISGCVVAQPLTPFEQAERLAINYEQVEVGKSPRSILSSNFNNDLVKATEDLELHISNHPDDVNALILAARIGRIKILSKGVVWSPSAGEKPPQTQKKPEHDLLNRALDLEPENAAAHYWQARLYGMRSPAIRNNVFVKVPEDLSKAIHHARRAVEVDPKKREYREALTLYLVAEQRFDEAIEVIRVVNAGSHPINRLLTDFQSLPLPDDAIYLPVESEGYAEQQIQRRRIHNYPQIRVRMYTILRSASEVLGYYRHLFPDIQFLENKKNTVSMSIQIFNQKNGLLVPTENIDNSSMRALLNGKGMSFNLVEFNQATEDIRKRFNAGSSEIFCVLYLVNFNKINQ